MIRPGDHGIFYIVSDANGDAIGCVISWNDFDARREAYNRFHRDSVLAWGKASDRLQAQALALTTCLPREYVTGGLS